MKNLKRTSLLFLSTILLSSCTYGVKNYPSETYINEVKWENNFLVCQLGDLHLSTLSYLPREFDYYKKVIYSHPDYKKPNLIVLNGDSFMDANKEVVIRTFEFFNSLEIPFCFNYGNHDMQGQYSARFIDSELRKVENGEKKYKYAMYSEYEDDDVYGRSNYVCNIVDDGKLKFQVFIMDSNSYHGFTYDSLHQDQIDWYKRMILASNGYEKMPEKITEDTFKKSMVFMHIPLSEMHDAVDDFNTRHPEKETKDFSNNVECAIIQENISDGYNKEIEVLKQTSVMKSSVLWAFSHNHKNSANIYYDNPKYDWPTRMAYGVKTGDGIFHDGDLIGASFYELYSVPKLNSRGQKEYFYETKMFVPYEGEAEVLWTNRVK